MKSQVLIKAWELFRTYEITFSQALKDAWKLAKRELVKIEFANTDTSLTEKRAELLNKFNSLKPNTFLNPIREKVKEQYKNAHKLSEQNKSNYINKFGYQKWMS